MSWCSRASAVMLNTFDALEQDSVNPLTALNPQIFTVGPLHLMQQHVHDERLKHVGSNLCKQDASSISWLDTKDPGSVVFVNFVSITIMTKEQLIEFGWGLANSKKDFLWITRPDIVGHNDVVLPPELVDETKGRGMMISWCPQEKVVAAQVREMIDGKHGEVMKKKSMEWKKKAEEAVGVNGSSYLKFDKLVDLLLNK
ncbi:hypothetical protein L1987_40520 [Smallanthus sonchifolius]|uniref:Uncharacterized protein n=1 Tax=Smallanthus sonchifolius TaxID=185202 RepID=A0ACB9GT24_9ASTR|nr:hypothetical protein L1987_40520 [Smallanthus sonchifolius]